LKTVPAEGQAIDRVIAAGSVPAGDEEFRLVSGVELTGRVEPLSAEGSKELGSFRLRGQMSCSVELQCCRCLEPLSVDVRENVDLIYLPQSKNIAPPRRDDSGASEDDRSLDTDELAVSFYRDHHIDLGHMIVEQIVLALPMKPLCREECRGLCPECGVNRNEASCECAPDESDPRWSALKALLGG
jgi:uncharacterized protein